MTPSRCGLGHRTSVFQHSGRWTILTVTLEFAPGKLGPPLTYRAVADAAGVHRGERVIMDETVAAVREVRARKGMILDRESGRPHPGCRTEIPGAGESP